MTINTIKAAQAIAGTLGNPSKMPGRSYGLPAADAPWVPAACLADGIPVPPTYGCAIGAIMVALKGTTCFKCYADARGNYQYSSVRVAQVRRASGIFHTDWVPALVRLITARVDGDDPYFRWHDSGDIQGLWHLEKIASVAMLTPWVHHWMPTREFKIVREYLAKHGEFPANLIVRLSAIKVDAKPPVGYRLTSTVNDTTAAPDHECPARHQDNTCGPCRACWDTTVGNVGYPLH
jgi:hypothetical protein